MADSSAKNGKESKTQPVTTRSDGTRKIDLKQAVKRLIDSGKIESLKRARTETAQ